MAKVIRLIPNREKSRNNLITASPWEFRWAESGSRFFRQVLKRDAALREERCGVRGCDAPAAVAGWHDLKGGLGNTIQALFLQRDDEEKMRQIYYLVGLVDCMINRRHPLLRTRHIRGLYGKVMTLKSILCLNWHGPIDQVLLPLHAPGQGFTGYPATLARAATMQELYRTIRKATDDMFDILSRDYVFYAPGRQ